MKALIVSVLLLSACNVPDPGDPGKCGVTETQLREAMNQVSRMKPYTGKRVGRCDLIVDDTGYVGVITPEIQRRVANELAHEKVGNSK